MNAVIGMAHLLMENNPREDQIDELQTLQFAANNLLTLINDILDFSKAEAGKIQLMLEEFNFPDFVDKLVRSFEPMAHMRTLTLNAEVDPKIPSMLESDRMRLTQVFNNLIGNAIKFTEKGSVTVKAKLLRLEP
ncbi:histidine kinase dimerization/phospho-acceptor domain-containing protein, partial [Arthrospira platensis SPKY1]|nr:histidine kinase dimerization/phospho-acceptor domain-containing protein [Arthrospira platensis SPKY1]